MSLSYIEPLRRAWDRMVQQLFRPFDPSKWIIVGFTCWLARLGEGGGGQGGVSVPPPGGDYKLNGSWDDLDLDPSTWASWWQRFWASFEPTFWIGLAGCVLAVILAVVLLFLWLSARGHFLFLDNAVHDRTRIKAPWKEYRQQGNSLFLWRLGFIVVCVAVMLVAAAPGIFTLISAASAESGGGVALGLVVLLIPVLLLAVVLAYIDLFLTDFVVPIMYQRRLKTTEAWRVFLPEMRKYGAELLIYGLFVLLLHLLVGAVFAAVVLLTCCVSLPVLFVLSLIPVIPTILLLPLHLTYRLFSLEFLGQLGADFQLLPAPAAPPPATGGGGEGSGS